MTVTTVTPSDIARAIEDVQVVEEAEVEEEEEYDTDSDAEYPIADNYVAIHKLITSQTGVSKTKT